MTERRQQGDDLTGRRGGYSALKDELHHFFRRIWVVVILIGLTSAAGLAGYGIVIREIQSQRHDACLQQNARHDNTEAALRAASDKDIEKAKQNLPTSQGEVAVTEIENRRDVTLGLIDTLQPKQNCDELAPKWGVLP